MGFASDLEPIGRYISAEDFQLHEELSYVTSGYVAILVPCGFVTDFASIPRALRGLIPKEDIGRRAAIVHDWLYRTKGLEGAFTRQQCDAIFYEAMRDLGVPRLKAWLMYRAVRRFGGFSFPKR